MHVMHSFGSGSRQHPQVDRLVAGLANGNSMLIVSPLPTAALLTAIEGLLRRTRILRVAPPLALPAFMEQIAARAGADTGSLEQGFNALTTLDTTCDRIALIVEDAHLLPPETLRYIDFSFWSAPHLQVILAGQPEVTDLLALNGYPTLRKRLAFKIVVPSAPLPDTLQFATPQLITAQRSEFEAGPSRALTSRSVSLAGAAMGAAIVLAMFTVRPLPLGGMDRSPAVIAIVGLTLAPMSSTAIPLVAPTLASEPAPVPAFAEPATENEPPAEVEPTVSAGVQPDMAGSMPVSDPELSRPVLADTAEPPTAPIGTPAIESAGASPPRDVALVVPDQGLSRETGPEPSPDPSPGTTRAPATAGPADPAPIVPVITAPRLAPPIPKRPLPRLAAQPAPARVERATSRADPALSYGQRCRAIVQRSIIGEPPTDADVLFLRNGCR